MGWWKRLFGKREEIDLDAEIAALEVELAAHDAAAAAAEAAAPKKLVFEINAADGVWLSSNGSYDQEVVGESHYQAALAKICGGHTEAGHRLEVVAELVYEDTNPYDDHAVAVRVRGEIVGYLPRAVAREVRSRALEVGAPAGFPILCNARIKGGWLRKDGGPGRGAFGIWLDFRRTKSGVAKVKS